MANLSEDIQCAGSDTRPPLLDRTDFASWQQRIRQYCRGNKNGVNILKSIDEGPFQMGIVRETLAKGTGGAPHLGPERPRVYSDLSPEEKDRHNANIRATNSLLQGLPKDIYTLISHHTYAKDIWDNVKMLLEVKLNRGLRDSNYDQLYAYLKQHEAHENENKMMLDRFTQHTVDPLALMSNGRLNRGQGNNPRGGGAAGYGGAQNRVGNANPDKMLLMQAQENRVTLNEEQLLFLAGGQDNAIDEGVDEQPVQDLALNVDNVFQADDCDAFDSDEHFKGIQKALTKEIKEMKDVFEELEAEVDQNVVDRKHDEIERKNLLIANDNLITECLSKEVFYIATNSELNVSRFAEMHVANTIVEARCLELKDKLSNLRDKSHNDNHNKLVNRFSNLEHYKELYDSIKITRAKHIEQVTALTTKNVNLKAQILNNVNSVIKNHVKPIVFAPGVNSYTDASGSQPRSNTKKNRISPAKGVNKMKLEEHSRTNKSRLRTTNRVDSSSRSKRTPLYS
nr:integrase, catalytic region, zinc finger, CCHC-type, peptidase aspartic, catalytic [Tanacetum cinerariifolium]